MSVSYLLGLTVTVHFLWFSMNLFPSGQYILGSSVCVQHMRYKLNMYRNSDNFTQIVSLHRIYFNLTGVQANCDLNNPTLIIDMEH